MTQPDRLLAHFKNGGTLTVAEALTKFGVYALSQRVGEMKKKHDIRSAWEKSGRARFKRYYLHIPETLFEEAR